MEMEQVIKENEFSLRSQVKMIKSTRPIGIKVVNMNIKEFYSLFNNLSYWQTQLMNAKMMELYARVKGWQMNKSAYMEAKEKIKNSYIRASGVKEALSKWSANRKKIFRGDISLPTFKNKRLFLWNQGFKLIRENGNFYIDARLTDKKMDYTRLILLGLNKMEGKSPNQFLCLERIFSGEYKVGTIQLFKDNGKIFVRLPYTFTLDTKNKLIPNRVMGVDLGIKCPAVCAFNDSLKRTYFEAEKIRLLKMKQDFEARRRKIQRQVTQKEKRKGRGKEYKLFPLTRINKDWNNFRTTFNHQLSKKIVDFAIKNQVSLIQLEDLTRSNKNDTLLGHRWPVGQLLSFIEFKAKEEGIAIRRINPRYTSRRCSKCGFINENFSFDERKKRKFPDFECQVCGIKLPADYNAARNVAEPNIEELIRQAEKKEDDSLNIRAEESIIEVA